MKNNAQYICAVFFMFCFGASSTEQQCVFDSKSLDCSEGMTLGRVSIEVENFFAPQIHLPFLDEYAGKFLSQSQINTLESNLRRSIYSLGYLNSQLMFCPAAVRDEGRRVLDIQVKTGSRVEIEKIEILGLKSFQKKELLEVIASKEPSLTRSVFGFLGFGQPSLEEDTKLILKFLGSKGYLDASVQPWIELSDSLKKGVLYFVVDEGKQYRFGKVQPDYLRTHYELAEGETFNLTQLDKGIEQLLRQSKNDGFAFAKAKQELVLEADRLSVNVSIENAEKAVVREVVIIGNHFTEEKPIRAWFSHLIGQVFNYTKAQAARLEFVNRSGYANARVSVKDNGDGSCDLVVGISEKFPWLFKLSPSYYSGEGFLFSSYIINQNILGLGIYGYVGAQISSVRKAFDLLFYEPHVMGRNFSFLLEMHNRYYAYQSFDSRSLGGGFRTTAKLFECCSVSFSGIFNEVDATYKIEERHFDEIAILPSKKIVSRATASTRIYPVLRGTDWNEYFYLDFGLTYSGLLTLSDFNFLEPFARADFGFSVSPVNVRAKVSTSLIRPIGSDLLPVSERYFLGGRSNLRGYQLFRVTPYVVLDDNVSQLQIGGDFQFLSSIEAELPIWNFFDLKGYVFSDLGNAFSSFRSHTYAALAASLGFGFSATVFGFPLKIEVAYPLVDMPGALPFDFYFGFSSVSF